MPRNGRRELAPGESVKIDGLVVLRDWERGREGNAEARIQKAQLTIGSPCTPTEGRPSVSPSSMASHCTSRTPRCMPAGGRTRLLVPAAPPSAVRSIQTDHPNA